MRAIRKWTSGLLMTLTVVVTAGPATAAESDAGAVEIAERVMEALGGRSAWDATHYLRFTFAGRRTHHWDRYAGRYRVEGTDRDGHAFVTLMDLGSREGRSWVDGAEVLGDELSSRLEQAWGMWVNDTYWLLMPYKLLDPGVHLEHRGEEVVEGRSFEVLRLTFDHVGLTPGDQYFVYVDPKTWLVGRWAYVLEDYEPGQTATPWDWNGWLPYGSILLSGERHNPESGRDLPLTDIAVFEALPDSIFESPDPIK